ncbi:hypothetical protein BH10ACT7_BH10ACT7_27360 [soil metagenome]
MFTTRTLLSGDGEVKLNGAMGFGMRIPVWT